ncbi:MAG: hypothetical protein JSR24_00300 [Proteobacteria bacterium]|nr:hypothetical protein [Pseudomonadota bacterium]
MTYTSIRPTKPPFGLSIQSYLLMLIAAIVVPLFALGAILAWDYAAAARRTIEANAVDAVDDLSDLIEREIQTTAGFLNGLAVYPRIQAVDADIVPKLADVARENGIDVMGLYDQGGHLVFNSRAADLIAFPSAKSVGVSEIVGGQKVFISGLLASEDAKLGFVYVSVPCMVNGTVAFVLVGGFSPSRFQALFADAGLRKGWLAGIVDRTGTVIARSEEAGKYVGRHASPETIEAARGVPRSGHFDSVSRQGVAVQSSFRRLPGTGLTAVVALPTAVIDAPLWHTAMIVAAVGLLVAILCLVLGVVVAGRVARAVHQFGYASVAFAAGDKVALPTSSVTELQDVSRSLEVTAGRRDAPGR